MKNLFILTVFALLALTSWKKDYVCSFDNEFIDDIEYNDLDKDEAEALEAACETADGDWSVK